MNLVATISKNLMPCPFCGSDDEVKLVPLYNEDGREIGGAIRCDACLSTFTHPEAATHIDLIAHWNERPAESVKRIAEIMVENLTTKDKELLFFGGAENDDADH